MKKQKSTITWNLAVMVFFLMVATAISLVLVRFSYNSSNVDVIYMLAVLLIARYSEGYAAGILSSLIGVLCVNFAFTYPVMRFNFILEGYLATFSGMLLTSVFTSAMTTRLKKQSQVLREREKLLMDAEKEAMRANLLRAVSHDLRTPLTGIIGLAEAYLKNGEQMTEADKKNLITNISEDANWLLNMVENLLSVTRIRDGSVKVSTNPELLEEVVSEAVMRFKKRMPQARVKVKVPNEALLVPMDAMLIEQVIINLLENAVYHSQVTEEIELLVERRGNQAVFRVRDQGVGIALDQLDTLFDGGSGKQAGSADSHKGMGIGLTICKSIIEAHQGTITASNWEGGAEFLFTLPLGKEGEQHGETDHINNRG